MKKKLAKHAVIIDLHERGFTSDFQFAKQGLWWIQEKIYVNEPYVSVLETYRFVRQGKAIMRTSFIMGIQILNHYERGILIYHVVSKI
ncbi:hypothetical protein QWZ08_01185 [Ferruginibacter paludis]|uniref:hypothetical protein n=1 Tax=Ferruginibacter paludis TaxID=1310417 RepID=UPI0025B29430|nr:hypothetical protein [Ferruginibacter paludis]MDN3654216.1 hypothetical protein [Ferruginibacter paludis]